ncbi:MAG: GatB/YqeY domain-containing protein [Chloroflexi bacterium]|nr:GatB/YqeY domain-containing protein [Chloroflexota bacterium]
MDMKTQLNDAVKESMRSGDEVRKRTLRMTLAAIKQIEVDRRISLDDAAVLSILQKEIKLRKEALDEAQKANRIDLADDAQAEIDVLKVFLPKGFSPEELRQLVQETIAETGAVAPADMGKVMKVLQPKIAGRAPGDQVSALVRELLQK